MSCNTNDRSNYSKRNLTNFQSSEEKSDTKLRKNPKKPSRWKALSSLDEFVNEDSINRGVVISPPLLDPMTSSSSSSQLHDAQLGVTASYSTMIAVPTQHVSNIEVNHQPFYPAPLPDVTRVVTTCQRCRSKKIKCDKGFPACTNCHKSGSECVSYDSITGAKIPRSYFLQMEQMIYGLRYQVKQLLYRPEQRDLRDVHSNVAQAAFNPSMETQLYHQQVPFDAISMANQMYSNQQVPMGGLSIPSLNQGTQFSGSSEVNETSTHGDSHQNPVDSLFSSNLALMDNEEVRFQVYDASTDVVNQELLKIAHISKDESMKLLVDLGMITGFEEIHMIPPKNLVEVSLVVYFSQVNECVPILHRDFFLKTYFQPIYGDLSEETKNKLQYKEGFSLSNYDNRGNYYSKSHEKYAGNTNPETTFYEAWLKDSKIMEQPPLLIKKGLLFCYMILALATSVDQKNCSSTISDYYNQKSVKFVDGLWSQEIKSHFILRRDIYDPSMSFDTDYETFEIIQSTLLLSHYNMMRSDIKGAWLMAGTALKLCINYGYSSENEQEHATVGSQTISYELDMKRRLFWCSYNLERESSIILQRPFAIRDIDIRCHFPSDQNDSTILPPGFVYHASFQERLSDINIINKSESKAVANKYIRFKLIQSQISTFFNGINQKADGDNSSLKYWQMIYYQISKDWFVSYPSNSSVFTKSVFQLYHRMAIIEVYGRSKKVPHVIDPDNFAVLFHSAKIVFDIMQNMISSNYNCYPSIGLRYLHISSGCFLYCIKHSSEIRKDLSAVKFQETVANCVRIFDTIYNMVPPQYLELDYKKVFSENAREVLSLL